MAAKTLCFALVAIGLVATPADGQYMLAELEAIVSPLPSDLQGDAGIYVEAAEGGFDHVRSSKNGMSCARRRSVNREGASLFDVRCHGDLFWPAVFLRWSIDDDFGTFGEVYQEMHRLIDAGRISMPAVLTAGHRILGLLSDPDPTSGQPGPGMNGQTEAQLHPPNSKRAS
jgi:hypothetical protein